MTTAPSAAPLTPVGVSATLDGAPRWLFTLTIFVGSFLLFQVQPMIARMALPRLGGAPAVWNSAMLVYQALLLGGYAWAHWIGRFSIRQQWVAHGALLLVAAAACLPLGLAAWTPPSDNDVFLFVPGLLLWSVGILLFAISAQAPLMQRWFAAGAPGRDPYTLYAASNLGSFGGLIAYPLLVEPTMTIAAQRWTWTVLYAGLVALVVACGWSAARAHQRLGTNGTGKSGTGLSEPGLSNTAARTTPVSAAPPLRTILLWIALSAVPSGLMLSTTTHLTTDIMAMPLMWAIPLGLYLLSFSIAFAERRFLADILLLLAPPMLLLSGGLSMLSAGSGSMAIALSSLGMLLAVAVALHTRLYALRPAADRLTFFYLMMAVGGVIGGLFSGLIAPLLFDWVYEHPLLVLASALLIPMPALIPWADMLRFAQPVQRMLAIGFAAIALAIGVWLAGNWSGWFLTGERVAVGALVGIGLITIGWRGAFVTALCALTIGIGGLETINTSLGQTEGYYRTRSYFGVYTVREHPELGTRTLTHGTTLHGTQLTGPGRERIVTSYYGPGSGVGLAFSRASALYGADAAIGVVGLGTGTLACYRQPGQQWEFFEIDPAMVEIARNSGRFRFMPLCGANVPIRLGDARLKLQEVPAHSLDMLAIDAFSSDAIPLHLLTREAFDVYARAIETDGLVLVHISNRFMNLEPVLRALVDGDAGNAGQWHALVRYDEPPRSDAQLARTGSIWVAMARDPAALARLQAATATPAATGGATRDPITWRPLNRNVPARAWSDDYASVLPLITWPGF